MGKRSSKISHIYIPLIFDRQVFVHKRFIKKFNEPLNTIIY